MIGSDAGPVLLDANVLLLKVVGSCDIDLISRFGRTRGEFTPDDYFLLQRWLSSADVLVSTPAVLAEVSNLCRGAGENHRRRVRAALATLIEVCDERYIPSREATRLPVFERLGLTDAGIALAAVSGLRVLTMDLDLFVELGRRGVDVENFNHLRAR